MKPTSDPFEDGDIEIQKKFMELRGTKREILRRRSRVMSWMFFLREGARVQVISFPRKTHNSSLRTKARGRPLPRGKQGWHLGERVDQYLWEHEIARIFKGGGD